MRLSYEQTQQRAEKARTELKKRGFINVPPFGWMHKDCLDFGLNSGAIAKRGDIYTLVAEVLDKEMVTGYRGRTPIVERKRQQDLSKIKAFFEYRDAWEKQRSQQRCAIDEEARNIMASLMGGSNG